MYDVKFLAVLILKADAGTSLLLSTCVNHLIASPTLMSQLREVMGNRLHIKKRESGALVELFPSLDIEGFANSRSGAQAST